MTNQHRKQLPPLCCPACGYNLTGSCTFEAPSGDCPECGLAYERTRLVEQQWNRAKFSLRVLIMELLLFPIPIGFSMICGGAVGSPFYVGEYFIVVYVAGPPLLFAFLVGGLLAKQYYPASISGIPPERRRGLKRHIILPWLLFFVIEVVLTAVYYIGGCAVVIIVLFR